MYLKIHFGNKPVFLCDERTPEIDELLHHPDVVFMEESSTQAVKSLLHELKRPECHAGVMMDPDLERLKKVFWKQFELVQAAGGLVEDADGRWLFIFRRGHWDLPKGKLDPGETLEECALREVREETGLLELRLGGHICNTYHTYDEFGKHILKESAWYSMQFTGNGKPVPQAEEDITEISWLDAGSMRRILPLSYPSIREVVDKAGIIGSFPG